MNNFRNLSFSRGYFYFQLIFIVFVYTQSRLYCQEKVTLSGYVSDIENNETMIGVNVIIPNLKIGTTTNEYGFFSLTVPRGDYKLQISFLGYKNQEIDLIILSDFSQNFNLQKEIQVLDEVVIEESSEFINLRNPEMSVNRLSISTIKKIPAVLGEADVIKSITLLPGVTNAGEGASGFNVRGGGADQNLILLDEAIIFNSSHLFGFFSVFNPESIKDIRLYKGGIPAKYGGRVSSVLNIFQKEGNKNKFNSQGGIGLISSRLLLEGPIKKETTSFLFGGRSSYAHLFLPLIESVDNNKAYFYDLNTKLSHRVNEKNTIFLSGYFGRDVFDIDNLFDLSYGNSVANFRWNHLFSNKLFSNLSMIYSDYDYTLDFGLAEFDWNLGITNFNLKYDLKYYLNEKLKIEYGVNSIYYKFDPGLIQPTTDNSTIQNKKLEDKFAVESAFYSSLDYKLLPKLQLNFGLRLSNFLRLGQKINTYENDNPLLFINSVQIYEEATPLGFIEYSKSEVIKQFTNLEPRFSLAYEIADDKSFKISYNRMAQYLHLISNTNSPTPIDVWAPSGKYIDPQLLNQVAVGYFETFNNKIYSLQAEVFYKTIKNRLDYIDGAELIANDAIEQVLLNGEARASGIEILFQKNEGKLTGWVAYTLSKSEQRTPGRTEKETGINNGNWYFTPYDKTHDFSLVSNYRINSRWNLNSNFIFQTGQPITYPNAQYQFQGFSIPNYETRNSSRLPSYHRLDISAIYKPKNKAGEWVFGIYNIYNRKNAASVRFQQNINNGTNEAIRLAIFGIIPSVTYNFKF
ncbi:MAG: collagen-binding protein [Flavobacteriaceae bacterium TMED68]|nr:MAG: collagen-binding protein [Flavobacteriaceae bacterium TMED68]|tara:strand:+ start:3008 stop:5404 length:2397 start_codon:yes stop_codon:yes gene_type:complete